MFAMYIIFLVVVLVVVVVATAWEEGRGMLLAL